METKKPTVEPREHKMPEAQPHHQTGGNPHYRQSKIEPNKPERIKTAPRQDAPPNPPLVPKKEGAFTDTRFLALVACLALVLLAFMVRAQQYSTASITPITNQQVWTNGFQVLVGPCGNLQVSNTVFTFNGEYFTNINGYALANSNQISQYIVPTGCNGTAILYPPLDFGGHVAFVYTNSNPNGIISNVWLTVSTLGTNPAPTTVFVITTNAGSYIIAPIYPNTVYSNNVP